MKYLILLRHAKSSWDNMSLADHARPLSQRGRLAAPIMGSRLAKKPMQPQHIISSTATRALTTAQIVASAINYKLNRIETQRNLFHAYGQDFQQVIATSDDNIDCLMLVGHNPGLTVFANQLLKSNQFDNIPTAGLVTLALDIDTWQQILAPKTIQARLIDYDYPKLST